VLIYCNPASGPSHFERELAQGLKKESSFPHCSQLL
jgi:hypothetical protein